MNQSAALLFTAIYIFVSRGLIELGLTPIFLTNRWYIVKRHLQSLQQQTPKNATGVFSNASSTDEYSLYAILEPALEVISSRYTAVGILEDMTTTMRLFDSALGMNHFNWTVEIQKLSARNEDLKRKSEEHAILHEAWNNPAIIKFISLDLILYEYATRIYAKQLEQYGL